MRLASNSTMNESVDLTGQVALVTGAAHRIGAAIVHQLHAAGMNVVLHYRQSTEAARRLSDELTACRSGSVQWVQGDLLDTACLPSLIDTVISRYGRLDVLVNNASSFYPTPVGAVTIAQWDDLLGTNLKAPFFLAQAAAPWLDAMQGCVVNIADIHADRPLKDYPVYSIAKAGLVMLTKTLARELAPRVRVNAVAPGAILWPEHALAQATREAILARTALKRQGSAADIARAVLYLVRDAHYTTGQVLTVDGGRSLQA